MSVLDSESLHRTVKALIDDGTASTIEEAYEILETYRLQILVGADVAASRTRQAMLITAVNAGGRAFLGGVTVVSEADPELSVPWAVGCRLTEAVNRFGGRCDEVLHDDAPTLVIGAPKQAATGSMVARLTWDGWVGGVVVDDEPLSESLEFTPAGVLAAGLGVGEAFQHRRGDVTAGRRDLGLSLWRPDLGWRARPAVGPPCRFLPSRLWLLGLGHLGQACAWVLGCLPYRREAGLSLWLVDDDVVSSANESTSLLAGHDQVGELKTRIVSKALETIGIRTRIVERRFDDSWRLRQGEPSCALAGFDGPIPRRSLGVFPSAVDAGLGTGPVEFLDMVVHRFPADRSPDAVFPDRPAAVVGGDPAQPAYQDLAKRRREAGDDAGDAACGVTTLAGRAVGAAFVGAVAASLMVGDVLRRLADGPDIAVVGFSLRHPASAEVAPNAAVPFDNPGFVESAEHRRSVPGREADPPDTAVGRTTANSRTRSAG